MTQKIYAKNVTLRDLKTKFAIQLVRDREFFPEWQTDLPEPTEIDKLFLDEIQEGYFNLITYPPVLEDTVKMSVLSPLMHLAGFFRDPFHIRSEESVSISAVDEEVIVEGRIDVLVLQDKLWMIVIESKSASFSIEAGLAQILSYMLANPDPARPTFGMITTGGSFTFIKLVGKKYSLSRVFELRNPDNELLIVLGILKRLAQLTSAEIE